MALACDPTVKTHLPHSYKYPGNNGDKVEMGEVWTESWEIDAIKWYSQLSIEHDPKTRLDLLRKINGLKDEFAEGNKKETGLVRKTPN